MNTRRKPWRKNLYDNAEYPDNYTSPTFLKDLQKNINVRTFSFHEAVIGATRLNKQITLMTAFLLVFYSLYVDLVSPELVLGKLIVITSVGYLVFRGRNFHLPKLKEDLKTVLGVFVFGYLFCPILHSLTDSISTDSIYSTTFFVMFLHLLTFDYGVDAFVVSKAISLNAAVFGAICLASRLASSFHAFVLLVSSIMFFALGPIFLAQYRSPFWLVPLSGGCLYILSTISFSTFTTYFLVLIFINVVCPMIFVSLQKHKNNIHGPWDEAILKDSVMVN